MILHHSIHRDGSYVRELFLVRTERAFQIIEREVTQPFREWARGCFSSIHVAKEQYKKIKWKKGYREE